VRWCVVSWAGVICRGLCCCWCCGEVRDGELVLNASNLFDVGDSLDRCFFVISSVTLMSDTSCSTGTFVYCTGIAVQSVCCLLL